MIDKISIKNFQSHPNTELELDPGINVITGSSDNGKTSIFRALYWIIYNRPSGNSFISNWIKDEKGNIKKEVTKSLGKYAPKVSEQYDVVIRGSRRSGSGYLLMLKRKSNTENK